MSLLAADDRAYLSAVHPVRYALGPPEAPLIVLNAADAFGCMWACDVPEGWDAPEVTTPIDRRSAGHGGYVGDSTYEARVLTFEGTVAAPTAAALGNAYRRLLSALLGQLSGFLRYTHLDETPAPMGLWVRPTGKPRWKAADDRVAEFAFVLVAEDPIKTGSATSAGPVRLPTAAGEGGYPVGGVMPWTVVTSAAVNETRRNLVPNPTPASTNSWFGNAGTGGTAATSFVAAGGPTGAGLFRLTYSVANTTAAGTSPVASIVADGRASAPLPIPVTAGQVYSAAISARTSVAQRLQAVLRWYDAAGGAVASAVGAQAVTVANTWTRFTLDAATAPAGAVYARIDVATVTGAGAVPFPIGATFDAAQAQLEVAAAAGTYFDGTAADTPTRNYAWAGAADNSPSVEQTATFFTTPSTGAALVAWVPNDGDEDSHAIYTVQGPVPRPRIQLGNGAYVALSADLGADDAWTVDTAAGTSTVNGVNRYDAWGAGSTFPLIPSGGVEVRLRSGTGGQDPAAALTVLTAPSWK